MFNYISAEGYPYVLLRVFVGLVAVVAFLFSLRGGAGAADTDSTPSGRPGGELAPPENSRGNKNRRGVEKDVHSIHKNRGKREKRVYRIPVDSFALPDDVSGEDQIHYEVVAVLKPKNSAETTERTVTRVSSQDIQGDFLEVSIPVNLGKVNQLKINGPGQSTLAKANLKRGRGSSRGRDVQLTTDDVQSVNPDEVDVATEGGRSVEFFIPPDVLPGSEYYYVEAVDTTAEEIIQQGEVGADSAENLVIQVDGRAEIESLDQLWVYVREPRRGKQLLGKFSIPAPLGGKEEVALRSEDFEAANSAAEAGREFSRVSTFLIPDRLLPEANEYLIRAVDSNDDEINRLEVQDPAGGGTYTLDVSGELDSLREIQVQNEVEIKLGSFAIPDDFEPGEDVTVVEQQFSPTSETERESQRNSHDISLVLDLGDELPSGDRGVYRVKFYVDGETRPEALWDFPDTRSLRIQEGEPEAVEISRLGKTVGEIPVAGVNWSEAREGEVVLDTVNLTMGGESLRQLISATESETDKGPGATSFLIPDRLLPDAGEYLIQAVDPDGNEINRLEVNDPASGRGYEIDVAESDHSLLQNIQVYDGREVKLGSFVPPEDVAAGENVTFSEEDFTLVPEGERSEPAGTDSTPKSKVNLVFDLAGTLQQLDEGFYYLKVYLNDGVRKLPLEASLGQKRFAFSGQKPDTIEVVWSSKVIGEIPLGEVDWSKAREDEVVVDRVEPVITNENGIRIILKRVYSLLDYQADGFWITAYTEDELDSSGNIRESEPGERFGVDKEVPAGTEFPIELNTFEWPAKIQVLTEENGETIGFYRVGSGKLLKTGNGLVVDDFKLSQ